MVSKKMRKDLLENSFWSFFSTAVNRIGVLIFAILATRMLMPEGYGLYTLIFSMAMIFLTLGDLGINQVLIRYIAHSIKEKKASFSYYNYLFRIKLVLGLSVFFLMLVLSPILAYFIFKNAAMLMPLIAASFFVLVSSMEGFYANIFYSIEKVNYLVLRESLTQILKIICLIGIVFLAPKNTRIVLIFLSFIFISIITLSANIYYLKKKFPLLFLKNKEKIDHFRINNFLIFFAVASLCLVLLSNIGAIILGLFVKSDYVGYYQAASSLIFGLIGLLAFPNMFLLSFFTKINRDSFEKVINSIMRYIAIFAIPASFGVIILGRYFIKFLYGTDYFSSIGALYVLAPIIFPAVLAGLFAYIFTANEKPNLFARTIFAASLLNILMNIGLIWPLSRISALNGMMGAAIACLLSWFFYFYISFGLIEREFKLRLKINCILKPILASIIMALVIYLLIRLLGDMTLFSGLIVLISGLLIYFIVMFLISGLTKVDLEIFYKLFRISGR